jgi:hypothetical protein
MEGTAWAEDFNWTPKSPIFAQLIPVKAGTSIDIAFHTSSTE